MLGGLPLCAPKTSAATTSRSVAVHRRPTGAPGGNHVRAMARALAHVASRRVNIQVAEFTWDAIDKKAVDTARVLAADSVEAAGNGHPGTAMSLAPLAHLLFQKVMHRDPSDSTWIGRDRFILSAGHASILQYVQFYLGGYGLEIDDLQHLRKWGSKTPGHPEYGHTDGVEITTGPLGQGLALLGRLRLRAALRARPLRPGDPRRSVRVRPLHLRDRRRRRHAGGHHERSRLARRIVSSSATSSRSTTRTRSRSRTTPTSPSPRASPSATRRSAGTSRSSTGRRPASTTRTSRSCTQPSRPPSRSRTSRRSSSSRRSSAGRRPPSRTRARSTVRRSAPTRSRA